MEWTENCTEANKKARQYYRSHQNIYNGREQIEISERIYLKLWQRNNYHLCFLKINTQLKAATIIREKDSGCRFLRYSGSDWFLDFIPINSDWFLPIPNTMNFNDLNRLFLHSHGFSPYLCTRHLITRWLPIRRVANHKMGNDGARKDDRETSSNVIVPERLI